MKNESLLKRLRDLGFIFILLLILACVLWECHKWGLDLRSEFSSVLNLFLIDFAFLLSTFDFPEAGKKNTKTLQILGITAFLTVCIAYTLRWNWGHITDDSWLNIAAFGTEIFVMILRLGLKDRITVYLGAVIGTLAGIITALILTFL